MLRHPSADFIRRRADPNNATEFLLLIIAESSETNQEFCCAGNKCNGNTVCPGRSLAACGDEVQSLLFDSGDGCSEGLICFRIINAPKFRLNRRAPAAPVLVAACLKAVQMAECLE